jgi:D-glycero-alpha-D-manno-heptose-7-phosphate kinase
VIEKLELLARGAGAIGAKVSGAGGGGFMMFVVPTERRHKLITALSDQGAMAYPVKFTERGSETWALAGRR